MKFSIITCTYNRLEKLKININSVINQKYQNYEHFIIDDGLMIILKIILII